MNGSEGRLALTISAHNPRISIIVPVYSHSGLVREAVYSVVSQPNFEEVDIVLVDDGCPDPQTYTILLGFSARYPNIHYIKQDNNGLSAARNTGIDFTLRALPTAEAIYFLDADNYLAEYSIASMQKALKDEVEADWFYPDIRMVGLPRFNDYGGVFNTYVATVVNVSEAGSLVRRRVFEAGVCFDERMRQGYEDWDFWLSALDQGFKGKHLPSLGLCYRKRAESMLAESHRSDSQIREYMRKKHKSLFQVNRFVEREHRELPRFAIWRSDEATVELLSDWEFTGERLTQLNYEALLWTAIREPTFASAGEYFISTTGGTISVLRRTNLLRWLSTEIEQKLRTHNFVTVRLAPSDENIIKIRGGETFSPDSHLLAVGRNLLANINNDREDGWIRALPRNGSTYNVFCIEITLPYDLSNVTAIKDVAVSDFVQFCLHSRKHEMRTSQRYMISDVYLGSRSLDSMAGRSREQFDNALLPPVASRQQGRVAFVLPHCDFGGVEKVTFCLARELKNLGYEPSLILLNNSAVYRALYAVEAFDDIYVFDPQRGIRSWSGEPFLGTKLPEIFDGQQAADLSALLSTFELVVSCHSAEILTLMAGLRRRGVTTATYLHLFDKSEVGGSYGHPTLALAYEHALDIVLTCSNNLAVEMAGLGVPRSKLLPLPNAPSMTPGSSLSDPVCVRGRTSGPLRVLFIGRLDAQKGLDRLTQILDTLISEAKFEFRIIGKSILSTDDLVPPWYRYLVEPPIYDDASLSEAYKWADVLLLPSRYEGLPLTLLEAMAHGVVPIVTDCGAVIEAVEPDVTGYVVSQAGCVRESIEHLQMLETDRSRLAILSSRARKEMTTRSWKALAIKLSDRIEIIRDRRMRTELEVMRAQLRSNRVRPERDWKC